MGALAASSLDDWCSVEVGSKASDPEFTKLAGSCTLDSAVAGLASTERVLEGCSFSDCGVEALVGL